MRITILFIVVITNFAANAQTAFDNSISKFENMQQLDSLFVKYGPLLIVHENIYTIPCECSPCRELAGNTEDRDLAGQNEDREWAGNTEDRNMSGESENDRDLAGNTEDRDLNGKSEERSISGNMEDRELAGDTEDRSLHGDSDNDREFAGDTEDRSLIGDTEGRDFGGNTEERDMAGNMEDRDMSGAHMVEFSCKRKSENGFILMNINPNAFIQYYDGLNVTEVKNLKITQ